MFCIFRCIITILFLAIYISTTAQNNDRPKDWATSISSEEIDNLYRVSDNLYRCAQPSKEGFQELQNMGIKTVVNLRLKKKDKRLLKDIDLKYFHLPMMARKPKLKQYQEFLNIISDESNHPILVHCWHGSDRTGTAVALYRIEYQNWENQKALDEMTNGGYGYHKVFKKLPILISSYKSSNTK
ncbi:MAG: tyrosine-protein phosphatase [Bacteroidia bacterium]|nr:tyrosine-protein phosphatase [Bacteroidia bacterium]